MNIHAEPPRRAWYEFAQMEPPRLVLLTFRKLILNCALMAAMWKLWTLCCSNQDEKKKSILSKYEPVSNFKSAGHIHKYGAKKMFDMPPWVGAQTLLWLCDDRSEAHFDATCWPTSAHGTIDAKGFRPSFIIGDFEVRIWSSPAFVSTLKRSFLSVLIYRIGSHVATGGFCNM